MYSLGKPDIPMWQRVIGVIALFAGLILYHDPQSPYASTLLVSVLFLTGASLVTRAWLAIALATAFFSWLKVGSSDLSAFEHYYYLSLAIIGSAYGVFVLSHRFRARIANTRDARWANRRPTADRQGESEDV
ncbi:MAG: hypothetical protein AAF541_00555 [Pseudomonadota bacterium]